MEKVYPKWQNRDLEGSSSTDALAVLELSSFIRDLPEFLSVRGIRKPARWYVEDYANLRSQLDSIKN